MKRFKGFTLWGKKERILGLIVVLAVVMLLSGCGANAAEINAQTPGFFNHYVVFPLSWLIQQLAQWFGGSFGLAIMTLTFIVRLALLPLMMRQTRAQQGMKRKMSAMQPDLDRIKKKYENKKDATSQQSMQQEMMTLYKEHQFNPLNIGCLPILIQLPILSGMYTAIRLTPELASHSFLWFRLGQPDWILSIVVAIVYLAQAKLSQFQMTPDQRKQFAIMGYLSPLMMAVFSFNAPAAMPLYWTVSGSFLLLQSLWFRRRYPIEEAESKVKLGEATPT
ncbi:membrane protein insertase YidC [Paenibacillus polymyxa]|uniref:membrane protein insertase YidC n=1 Tax=Paenibacillus polymyxa TaxID=1406 RepID=UPI002AB56FD7|nr:membrane protein insertase YidC [Paenibacillus polymyxa]MDY8023479.1 membrane protein insertase YidC [Paenibacillus polymyxa]